MAAVFFPTSFGCGVLGRARPATAKARLALALAVSACLHVWLAGSVVVEAPKRPVPPAASALAVRLEPAATSAGGAAQTEPESVLDGVNEPRALPANRLPADRHGQPPAERVARGAEHDRRSAPPDAAVARAARVPAFLSPTVEPIYHPVHELDVYPAPLARLRFEYPERAVREQVGGRVLIRLLIDQTGTVDGVSVVSAQPAGYFEEAVRAVFWAARFSPARKDGRVVGSRVLISVAFDPSAGEGALR